MPHCLGMRPFYQQGGLAGQNFFGSDSIRRCEHGVWWAMKQPGLTSQARQTFLRRLKSAAAALRSTPRTALAP